MDNDLVVSTSSGRFRGLVEGGVASYLGIPYAEPPVGALRFRAPQPFRPTSDVVDVRLFGAASIQTIPPLVMWIYPPQNQQSDDFLSLNVLVPQDHGTRPPLLV